MPQNAPELCMILTDRVMLLKVSQADTQGALNGKIYVMLNCGRAKNVSNRQVFPPR
jgi:hypothetical protein